jgi:hypothetical protein
MSQPTTSQTASRATRKTYRDIAENLPGWSPDEAVCLLDASWDTHGRAGVAMALYTGGGLLQLLSFKPIMSLSAYHAEAEALDLALSDWQSPYIQKPNLILTDCKNLADYVQSGARADLPCWWGYRTASKCRQKLLGREQRDRVRVCHLNRAHLRLPHTLASLSRRSSQSFTGVPTGSDLRRWGLEESGLAFPLRQPRPVHRLEAANLDPG